MVVGSIIFFFRRWWLTTSNVAEMIGIGTLLISLQS